MIGPYIAVAVLCPHDSVESIWLAYSVFVLLALFSLPNLSSALIRTQSRLLFLRKFHSETGCTFPVSIVMDLLVQRGYEVVTLRDSIVRKDRSSARPLALVITAILAWVVGFPFLLASGMLIALGVYEVLELLLSYELISSSLRDFFSYFCIPAIFLPTWLVFVTYRDRSDREMRGSVEWISRTLAGALSRPRHPRSAQRLRRSMRWRGQLGMTVIATTDENWRHHVEELILWADVVFMDVSTPSIHIATEVDLLSNASGMKKIVWLCQEPRRTFKFTSSGYEVLGRSFAGAPTIVQYPRAADSDLRSLYDRSWYVAAELHAGARHLADLIRKEVLELDSTRLNQQSISPFSVFNGEQIRTLD